MIEQIYYEEQYIFTDGDIIGLINDLIDHRNRTIVKALVQRIEELEKRCPRDK